MKTKNTKRPANIPPEITDPWAVHEYQRVTGLLGNRINELDHSLLVDYANTYADTINLRAQVDLEGVKLIGAKGGEYINPTLNILSTRMAHLAQLRRDLYFTPRSRVERMNKTKSKAGAILDDLENDAASAHDND